jgi:hypothetical protein
LKDQSGDRPIVGRFPTFGLTFLCKPVPRIGYWTRFSLQPPHRDADALYPAVTQGAPLGGFALGAFDIGLVLQLGLGVTAS